MERQGRARDGASARQQRLRASSRRPRGSRRFARDVRGRRVILVSISPILECLLLTHFTISSRASHLPRARAAQRSPRRSRRRPVDDGGAAAAACHVSRALRRRAAPACVACCWARTGLQRLALVDLAVSATIDLVWRKGAVSRCRVQSSPARRRCRCESARWSCSRHTTHNRQQELHRADSLRW